MEIYPLDIRFEHQGKQEQIFPVLLKHEDKLMLVDCAYPGFLPLLEEAAGQHGFSLKDLSGIIITHDDLDHVGSLYEIKSLYPSIQVWASQVEAPYISGKRKSARLQQAERLYDTLPEEFKPGALQFQEMLRAIRPAAVDHVFVEDAPWPFADEVSVIPTPGHTPGHISLYLPESKTLIAGDAFVIEKGEFEIANPQFTLDLRQALASVERLSHLEIASVICYHGGSVEGEISARFDRLLTRYADSQTL